MTDPDTERAREAAKAVDNRPLNSDTERCGILGEIQGTNSEKNGEIAKNVTTYWWSLSDGERKQLEHCIKEALDAKDRDHEAELKRYGIDKEEVLMAGARGLVSPDKYRGHIINELQKKEKDHETLIGVLVGALEDSLSGFKYVKERNLIDCEYGNGLGYERCIFKIDKALSHPLVQEYLKKSDSLKSQDGERT